MKPINRVLERVFQRSRVFLPVIHPISRETALASILTAVQSGADGIFLIDQGMGPSEVLELIPEVHRLHAHLWIGVNLLDFQPEEVMARVAHLPVGGIWVDNAEINERSDVQPAAERFQQARQNAGWQGLYFGGVAFKGENEVADALLADAARHARPWMDVITSSGSETGRPPTVAKAMALRSGAGTHPLALASGISPENIAGFLPYADAYLVATGIETEKGSGILVPERTKLLADRIHAWSDGHERPQTE